MSEKRKSSGLLHSELDSVYVLGRKRQQRRENGWIGAAQLALLRTHFGKQKTGKKKTQKRTKAEALSSLKSKEAGEKENPTFPPLLDCFCACPASKRKSTESATETSLV